MWLRIWGVLAIFALGIDMTMGYRRLSGRMGKREQADFLATARRYGGKRNLVIVSIIFDILIPPATLAACLIVYLRRREVTGSPAGPDEQEG